MGIDMNVVSGPLPTVGYVTGVCRPEGWTPPAHKPLAESIFRMADGEKIEGVVIGYDYDEWEDGKTYLPDSVSSNVVRGTLLTWDKARSILWQYDEEHFDAFCVWTRSKIIFGGTYDGDDWVVCLPRNPMAFRVVKIGG